MSTITDQRASGKRSEGIQWTDASCNPFKLELPDGKRVNACVKISPGCRSCYAESIVNNYWPKNQPKPFPGYSLPLLQMGTPWLDTELLRKLLRWKPKPPFKSPDGRPKVFAFDMTDLFLDLWPDDFIDAFMAVVAIRQDIDFQVLTKRPIRMRGYLSDAGRLTMVSQAGCELGRADATMRFSWLLRNLHVGVSCEDQQRADERIPILLRTPAAVRFVSYEPAVGPVDWCGLLKGISLVIIGGESGHAARPFNIEWAKQTIAQCKAAGVAVFCKQLGASPLVPYMAGDSTQHRHTDGWPSGTRFETVVGKDRKWHPGNNVKLKDHHGGDPSEWPEGLRVREWPTSTTGGALGASPVT